MAQTVLAESTDYYRLDAAGKLDPKRRSALGQFMTPIPIARFMASLFDDCTVNKISLLDAGAGVGSLSAAFVEEICARKNKLAGIDITAYEIEPVMLDYLEATMRDSQILCSHSSISMTTHIKTNDFIEDSVELLSHDLFQRRMAGEVYSHAILNPPYKKISSASDHRKWLRGVGIETSNLYTAFLALAIKLLKPGGEVVAIIPRSFCNGPYFKPFRELLLSEVAIRHIHVFESRSRAFKDDEVLQENIIFHGVKGGRSDEVVITASPGSGFVEDNDTGKIVVPDMTYRSVSFNNIVKPDDPEKFIHIATSEMDQRIFDRISVFGHSLPDLDIQVSTGPVVDFRLKNDLRITPEEGCAPLLYPVHFKDNRFVWPKESKKPNAIHVSEESRKWLWPNEGRYVVTRRFTSKEEKRRVVACVYDSSPSGELVGFENHLNVFHKNQKGLPEAIATGLAVYLNSTLVDKYFRQFSGHTQVNATDLRMLNYPDSKTLKALAKKAGGVIPGQEEIDRIIEEEIKNMAGSTQNDPLMAQQKTDEALSIVKALGMPRGQHNERSALTLLAILNLKPENDWADCERPLIGITPIMEFCRDHYGKEYAPNTRETFRRQTMHQFVDAGIAVYNPDKPDRPVNSPKACYQVSTEAFDVIVTYGSNQWDVKLKIYLEQKETLAQRYAMEREMQMIPVEVAKGEEISLTPGAHSQLIKDIITEFAPRYAPGSEVIYVGDTGDKVGYFQREGLAGMGVEVDKYGKMPDVVLYFPEKDWLLLIESVTSHGPVDGKRHGELSKLFENSKPGLVYVTAFPDRGIMSRYITEISWETEVWVAEAPTHMIHFNGERFLGPYDRK
ncbi:MAG: N-6 DNA methylase [Gammaproteobacteria bacterium]|nr:N-6 DNA methylase [Gammaproteobacteria bacterium]